jgi:hydroxymethylpyrimidine pyrophosphatase-like HAD family hydrolase
MDIRPKTIICDIDGTLVKHQPPWKNTSSSQKLELLPGTIEKLSEWDAKGFIIILITGRKESLRLNTEKQLSDVGIFYDQLIMGVGGGARIIINDNKPDGSETAFAFSLKRNDGISKLDI